MLLLVQVITLVALGAYLLTSSSASFRDFCRVVAGIGAVLWAILIVIATNWVKS